MSDHPPEERPLRAAPLHEQPYRGIHLPTAWASRLRAAEQAQGEAAAGPWLHLMARAMQARTARLPDEEAPLTLWLRAALDDPAPGGEPFDLILDDGAAAAAPRALWIGPSAAAPDGAAWRGVPLPDGRWLAGRGERVPRYRESEVERLIALLLAVMAPAALHLGPDVVFDASARPSATRVQFSGAGGTLAAGELLIAYGESVQRYSPQPGAVALLLTPPLTPPSRDHATLTLGEQTLTLIIV